MGPAKLAVADAGTQLAAPRQEWRECFVSPIGCDVGFHRPWDGRIFFPENYTWGWQTLGAWRCISDNVHFVDPRDEQRVMHAGGRFLLHLEGSKQQFSWESYVDPTSLAHWFFRPGDGAAFFPENRPEWWRPLCLWHNPREQTFFIDPRDLNADITV